MNLFEFVMQCFVGFIRKLGRLTKKSVAVDHNIPNTEYFNVHQIKIQIDTLAAHLPESLGSGQGPNVYCVDARDGGRASTV